MDRVARRSDDPRVIAEYVIGNPVRGGLVAVAADYPFQVLYPERFR